VFGTGAFWPSNMVQGEVASIADPFDPAVDSFTAASPFFEVTYAGTAPGMPYGVFRLDVRVSGELYLGALPLLTVTNTTPLGSATSNAVQIYFK